LAIVDLQILLPDRALVFVQFDARELEEDRLVSNDIVAAAYKSQPKVSMSDHNTKSCFTKGFQHRTIALVKVGTKELGRRVVWKCFIQSSSKIDVENRTPYESDRPYAPAIVIH
jgi:hypothetical protein